jgi:hypothetical protein
VLGRSLGAEDRRRGELGNGGPTATAEARAPTSRQLGYANTWVCKLGVCEERVWTCSGGQESGRGDELTEAASMADDDARWPMRVRARQGKGLVLCPREVGWG